MNGTTTPVSPARSPGARSAVSETRLRGWWLVAARTVAFGAIGLTVVLGIVALVNWRRLAVPCADALYSCLMTPEQVAPLARLGITPTDVALMVVVLCCLAVVLSNGVAALLLWRRSDDAMGLLVAVTLVLLPAFFTPMYQTLTGEWRIAGGVISGMGGICFLLLMGLFPSGRFVPRWNWLPLLAFAVIVSDIGVSLPAAAALPIILLGVLSIVGGQIYRYRVVSTPLQRQQTKWAVTGIVLAIVINQLFWQPAAWLSVWAPALQGKDSLYPLLMYLDYVLLISALAICFGIAIVRYRLYDIDVIIRRTLIYGTLTAILAGVYFAVVLGTQALAQRLTGVSGEQPAIIVVTTLLVAALFTPLRRWLQALIDRAFFRSKYDATRTLMGFGAKVRLETDVGALREQVVEVARQTMQPVHVSLWLRAPDPSPAKMPAGEAAPPR